MLVKFAKCKLTIWKSHNGFLYKYYTSPGSDCEYEDIYLAVKVQTVTYRVSQQKKKKKKTNNNNNNTAITMRAQIKDRHKTLNYFKSVLIATTCESFTWLAYSIPKCHQLNQPHPLNHFVHGQIYAQNIPTDSYWFETPYKLTFPI